MSIILKGIDMPKDGEIKKFELFDDGSIYEDKGVEWQGYPQGSAIQIPKGHGRLIDETEVKKNSIDDGYDLYVSWTDIDNAPSILEAEE